MALVTFDTLKFVERLEAVGMPRVQAVALAEAQKESFHEALDSALATKADIIKLETSIARLEASTKVEIARLDTKIDTLDLKFTGKFNLLQWMLAFNLAFTMAMLWKMFGH
jgi:hypothetical protein